MEEIACIFCNIWNAQVLIEENGYLGRKCANCGLIYISPRPRAEAVVELYENDNAQISADAQFHSSAAPGSTPGITSAS